MRTDSTRISEEARASAKKEIVETYGEKYYENRYYRTNKDAQDAHEAIRPAHIEITPDELKKSFITYRKDILQMPILALEEVTKYMQLRQGVRYAEEVGELAGSFEIGPFSYTRIDDEQVKIVGRKLETFLGSGVKEFNPISVVQSIYGSAVVQGDALKNTPITNLVAMYLFKLLGEAFRNSIFTAKRNDAG